MAYDYGSIDLGIRNPFKIEGAVRTVAGLAVSGLGLVNLLSVQGLVQSGDKLQGWVTLGVGILLMIWGLKALGSGLFQIMRFFVGRSVPTSLAENCAKSEQHVSEPGVYYRHEQIEQMLQGRKNITFKEPKSWFARALHTLMPRLLFLPYAYRNMAMNMAHGLVQTAMGFLCYGLAWFSGTTGLTNINETPVLDWLALILSIYLVIVWWRKRQPLTVALQKQNVDIQVKGIVVWLVLAIALPVGLSQIHFNVSPLPNLAFDSAKYIFMVSAFSLLTSALVFALLRMRMAQVEPRTEVSELRDNWQRDVHPQELFIHFENIIMANRRYREAPNRMYRGWDANLVEQGGDDKGRFGGEMIQETQPAFRPTPSSSMFKYLKVATTAVGFALLVLAAFWLNNSVDDVAAVFSNGGNLLATSLDLASALLTMLVIWMFGSAISHIGHAFWAEMQFESRLVYFQAEGTYSQSKFLSGSSIYDSNRSENVVVRSSITPWILSSRVITSCFTESGTNNLENPRFILEMHTDDDTMNAIGEELLQFLSERRKVASLDNEQDVEAASKLYQINQQTSAHMPGGIAQQMAPQLDHERAEEYANTTEQGENQKS